MVEKARKERGEKLTPRPHQTQLLNKFFDAAYKSKVFLMSRAALICCFIVLAEGLTRTEPVITPKPTKKEIPATARVEEQKLDKEETPAPKEQQKQDKKEIPAHKEEQKPVQFFILVDSLLTMKV